MSVCSFHAVGVPVYLNTMFFLTFGHDSKALSTLSFSGIFLPPLMPSSAVMTYSQSASIIRELIASGENPPNTTE